jgi:hypothetical protein
MHKAINEITLIAKNISRRKFWQTAIAVLSAGLLPGVTTRFSTASAATPEKWMCAQPQLDVAAANSDRPNHGPMRAYDAWPAVTVDALCRLGYWQIAGTQSRFGRDGCLFEI